MRTFKVHIATLLSLCCCVASGNRSPIGNCPGCKKFDLSIFQPLKRVAMIKAEILQRLGISQSPTERNTEPKIKDMTDSLEYRKMKTQSEVVDSSIQADGTREVSEMLSYSELPENFTDEHIIQFKVSGQNGQHLQVQSANLVIRVKCKHRPTKEHRSSSSERKKRKRKQTEVDLVIYSVNSDGKPSVKLASVKSKLRKTKWLRVNLPKYIVQKAVDSSEGKFQVYVKCIGCDKKTRLILARKGRNNNGHSVRKLHKRRPILYLHTQIESRNRKRRNVDTMEECSRNGTTVCVCQKKPIEITFSDLGWNWVVAPVKYRTLVCLHTCFDTNPIDMSDEHNSVRNYLESEHRSRHACRKIFDPYPLLILYFDTNGTVLFSRVRNMVVTDCQCMT